MPERLKLDCMIDYFRPKAHKVVEDINPNSLKVIKNALIEPAVITEETRY